MENALLVITDRTSPSNRYGPYLEELLRAEGLSSFRVEELSDVSQPLLTGSGVVVLTRCSVNQKQRDLLGEYVAAGGELVVIAPETIWEPLIGLTPLPAGAFDGYLRLAVTQDLGRGLPAGQRRPDLRCKALPRRHRPARDDHRAHRGLRGLPGPPRDPRPARVF